jgi:hypothetical protein
VFDDSNILISLGLSDEQALSKEDFCHLRHHGIFIVILPECEMHVSDGFNADTFGPPDVKDADKFLPHPL